MNQNEILSKKLIEKRDSVIKKFDAEVKCPHCTRIFQIVIIETIENGELSIEEAESDVYKSHVRNCLATSKVVELLREWNFQYQVKACYFCCHYYRSIEDEGTCNLTIDKLEESGLDYFDLSLARTNKFSYCDQYNNYDDYT